MYNLYDALTSCTMAGNFSGSLIQLGPSNIHHLPRITDRIRPLHDRGALIQLGPSNIHHLPRITDRIRPLHDRGVGGGGGH